VQLVQERQRLAISLEFFLLADNLEAPDHALGAGRRHLNELTFLAQIAQCGRIEVIADTDDWALQHLGHFFGLFGFSSLLLLDQFDRFVLAKRSRGGVLSIIVDARVAASPK